eukprot:CAMPEP_0183787338 /NCGR_PEP_ID=MMETSP0739-20130205/67489_1 /TAXON_ID=385413 /ORGANISM="Thalassiosira miniscula, Strain CCMP1093" /LENGTH=663 /DNA_ID=CAMNT_0026031419 /DNA_START=33 /DNA_END=2026 /DNA_ORIENTATION=-
MATIQSAPTVKRVMSKDCSEGMREDKKSKTKINDGREDGEDGGVVAVEGMRKMALVETAEKDGEGKAPFSSVNVPVATISHHASRASTTHSSLSDEGMENAAERAQGGLGEGGNKCSSALKRQVSNDDSLVGKNSLNGGSSASSNTSEGNRASVGNWGWFEDVHGPESSFLPVVGKEGGSGDMTNSGKKKKGGLLHIGSELMQNVLQAFVEPHKQETNTMAVTAPTYVLVHALRNFLWTQVLILYFLNSSVSSNAQFIPRFRTLANKLRRGAFGLHQIISIEPIESSSMMCRTTPDYSTASHNTETNTMAVTAPTYVLEESLSSQKLWKQTAGNRPPQPVEERAFFEQMWAQNFTRSKVKYEIPVEVLTASTPISISPFNDDGFIGEDGAPGGNNLSNYNLAGPFNMKSGDEHGAADPASVKAAQADVAEATLNQHLNSNGAVEMYFDPNRPKDYNLKTLGPHHHHHTLVNKKVKGAGEENDLTVVVRGDNVFGTTVSKSFPRVNDSGEAVDGIDTVSISIASYRVVESKKHGKYAQYLVIFCDGNFRNTVGVWKRYSDFSELSRKVTHGHSESCAAVVTGLNPLSVTEDHDVEILPNAITSWRLLKKRQRWYRCLDAGYLSLKVFLLERFLHDILFESSNPQILRDFVGVNSSEASKLNTKG